MRIVLSALMAAAVIFTFSGGCVQFGLPEQWCTAVSAATWAVAVLAGSVTWLEAAATRA